MSIGQSDPDGEHALFPGLRISIATMVGVVAVGMMEGKILRFSPDLEPEDLKEVMRLYDHDRSN